MRFMEVVCENYKVMVDEKRVRNDVGAGPSRRNETRGMKWKDEASQVQAHHDQGKEKSKLPSVKLCSEIEKATDLKVMKKRILHSHMEFILCKVLGIVKKDFRDTIIDLVKRKQLLTKQNNDKSANVISMGEVLAEEDFGDNHYMMTHWAKSRTETHMCVGW